MKVAYIFATQRHNVTYVLAKMILPQLEQKRHGVDVVGMFFFEDNNYVLVDVELGQKSKFTLNRFRPWAAEPFATVDLFA